MASIPLREPTVNGVTLPPAPHLDPESFGHLATAGLRSASQALGVIAEQARIQKTLNEESDRLAADRAANVYKLNVATAAQEIQADLTVPADQYANRVEDASRKAREAIGKSLTSPRARVLYEAKADDIATHTAINARSEGLKLQLAGIKAAEGQRRQDLQRTAIFAPDEATRAQAMTEIENGITLLTGKGIYSATEGEAHRRANAASIAKGRLEVAWADPKKRPTILGELSRGEVQGLDADDQLALREQLQNRVEAETRRAREDERHARAERADAGLKDVNDLWRNGDLPGAKAKLREIRRDVTDNDYAVWDDRIQQPPKPAAIENDRATMLRLQPRVYSVDPKDDPRAVLKEVNQALVDGHINDGTHRVMANELQNRILHDQAIAERRADRAAQGRDASLQERKFVYTQGKDMIEETFKTTGFTDKFDNAAQEAKIAALQDYYVNTNPYAPKMTTGQWMASRMPEYRARVTTRVNAAFKDIDSRLVQAGIPFSGDLKHAPVVNQVHTYLLTNKDTLIRKHGTQGFYDLAQQVKEAQIMGRELERITRRDQPAPASSGAGPAPAGPGLPPSMQAPKRGGR